SFFLSLRDQDSRVFGSLASILYIRPVSAGAVFLCLLWGDSGKGGPGWPSGFFDHSLRLVVVDVVFADPLLAVDAVFRPRQRLQALGGYGAFAGQADPVLA